MEEFDFDLIPEFDSNDENSFSNSSNTSPNNNQEFILEDLFTMDGNNSSINYNNNFLMSSNFFQEDNRIKNEREVKSENLQESHNFLSFPQLNNVPTTFTIAKENQQTKIQATKTTEEKKKRGRGRPRKNEISTTTKGAQKKTIAPKKVKREFSEEDSFVEDSSEKAKKLKMDLVIDTEEKSQLLRELLKVPTNGPAFMFNKDQLLLMNSGDIEKYYEEMKKIRELTDEEEKMFKKHNRLIRNRESAQKSRMKKRMHVDKLEKQINQLQNKINSLEGQNLQYLNEINSLRDRNSVLENLLMKSENNPPKFDVKKGVFLFMIVFSFGLFFRFNFFPQNSQLQNLPMNPYVATNTFGHNRGLLSNDPLPNSKNSLTIPSNPSQIPNNNNNNNNNQRTKIQIMNSPVMAATTTKNNNYFSRKHDKELVISAHDALVKQHSHDGLSDETSYIYCSEAKRVSKGSSKSPVVGFLVPSDFLNDTNLIPQYNNQRPPLVEITCNVMEVFPIFPLAEKS